VKRSGNKEGGKEGGEEASKKEEVRCFYARNSEHIGWEFYQRIL